MLLLKMFGRFSFYFILFSSYHVKIRQNCIPQVCRPVSPKSYHFEPIIDNLFSYFHHDWAPSASQQSRDELVSANFGSCATWQVTATNVNNDHHNLFGNIFCVQNSPFLCSLGKVIYFLLTQRERERERERNIE